MTVVAEPLLSYDAETQTFGPLLATSSEASEDQKIWTLKLRAGVNHHDGTAFDGEDVAHSALVKAFERIEGFRGESTVETWLHTITLNECRMLRRQRRPASLDDVGEPVDIDEANDPELVAEEAELRLEVELEILPGYHAYGTKVTVVEMLDQIGAEGGLVQQLFDVVVLEVVPEGERGRNESP